MDKPDSKTLLPLSPEEGHDPLEAIYALNIGDFIAENFISDDLLQKISSRLTQEPNKIKAQLEELIQIYSIDKTLGLLGLDTQAGFLIYDSIAATLCLMFQVDACHLFQVNTKDTGEQYLSLTGTSLTLDRNKRWEVVVPGKGPSLLSQAFQGSQTQTYERLQGNPYWMPLTAIDQDKTQSLLVAPLREGGKPFGILVLEYYTPQPFAQVVCDLAEVSARVFVISMRLQKLVAEAQQQIQAPNANPQQWINLRAQITESIADLGIYQHQFLENLSRVVDHRNQFPLGHSKRVAELARAIAEALELNEKTTDLVYIAGLLGSIGKVHIPQEILQKKDSLSAKEWDCLRDHPNVGVSLLVKINFLSEIVPYIQHSQEHWDGKGTPDGIKEKSIPLGSRILAVANAYYAMTEKRPYREAPLDREAALHALKEEAGKRWDPLIVETLSTINWEWLV